MKAALACMILWAALPACLALPTAFSKNGQPLGSLYRRGSNGIGYPQGALNADVPAYGITASAGADAFSTLGAIPQPVAALENHEENYLGGRNDPAQTDDTLGNLTDVDDGTEEDPEKQLAKSKKQKT
ncbi:hypothetical protein H4R34_004517 [Dimargaris verticillata]|uniref:Secreted protein n=1 Tax=Dimargaris verticillata TaxID=2761393 RepID=A0A9W8B4R1_9FUNG|nr:hypothetical protein H4R34_004517 [Dimargaris verticillata]